MSKKAWFGIFGIAAVFCGLALIIYLRAPQPPAESGASERRPALDFTLKDASGVPHSLHDLRGNVVVLHFWASWCPPCVGEIPKVIELARLYEGKPFRVLAVSLDDRWSDAEKILPSKGLPADLVSVIDLEHKLPEKYGTYQYPETYLLDRDLKIVAKLVGPQEWQNPNLAKVLMHLIGGQK